MVRGRDLLDSTARQLWLMDLLGLERPRYGHVPVIVDEQGDKLSKQQGAPAIHDDAATSNLQQILRTLGLMSEAEVRQPADPDALLALGVERWRDGGRESGPLLARTTLAQAQIETAAARQTLK